MTLAGFSLIGFARGAGGGATFRGFDPSAGQPLAPEFHAASAAETDRAVSLAAAAAPRLAALSGPAKGRFLRAIAARLDAAATELAECTQRETGLPPARCLGEVGRTSGQLRLFAEVVEQGDWLDARIETAQPTRTPTPKPDHRSMYRALGPVAVFGAANFPLAFSVAGGDTAAALAAGCPVIVKAHPAHPGTSERVGSLIVEAVREQGLPEGSFSLLFDDGHTVATRLLAHPDLRAVGFTGSRRGGLALIALANARAVPIPVYAEMSSLNPVFVFAGAIAGRGAAVRDGLLASMTLGVGQFCTKPGLVVLQRSPEAEAFVAALAGRLAAMPAAVMLSPGLHRAYVAATEARAAKTGVQCLVRRAEAAPCSAAPALFATDLATFVADPELQDEVFGPSTLLLWVEKEADFRRVAEALAGNLTATLQADDAELQRNADLIAMLAERAGRVIVNGFPTGVEVSHAIVHGGPYPALSDGRGSAVGSRAILRFARQVCFQSFPDAALPEELRDANPLGLQRLVDGRRTADRLA